MASRTSVCGEGLQINHLSGIAQTASWMTNAGYRCKTNATTTKLPMSKAPRDGATGGDKQGASFSSHAYWVVTVDLLCLPASAPEARQRKGRGVMGKSKGKEMLG